METKLALPVQSKFSEEVAEWIEALSDPVVGEGPVQGAELIAALRQRAREAGISTPSALTTPYLNTIPKHDEVPYPGDRKLEERLEALIRWNAMARIRRMPASVDTSPPTPPWPPCWKWATSISSTPPTETSRATLSTSKATLPQVSMRALTSKDGLMTSACCTSATNYAVSRLFLPILIRGLC